MSDSETRSLLNEEMQKKSKLYNKKTPNMEATPGKSGVKYERLIGKPSPSPSRCKLCEHAGKKSLEKPAKKNLFCSKNKK